MATEPIWYKPKVGGHYAGNLELVTVVFHTFGIAEGFTHSEDTILDSDETCNGAAEEETRPETVENFEPSTSVGAEVDLFIKQIDSLVETLPLTMYAIKVTHDYADEQMKEFMQEHCETEDEDEDENGVLVPLDYVGRFKKLESQLEKSLLAGTAVPRSFLVSLVSHYDAFLGGLIRSLFLARPDILSDSEKNITFSQLVGFGSVEDAREYIVEKEVETVLRDSHSKQFDWLESKFGLKLREGLSIWPQFIEVTERRNLFVHNRGIVSNQYLQVCRKHNVTFDKEPQVGEELRVPPEYFSSAYETIFEIGVKLAHVLWRKVQPEDREAADNNLVEIGYDLLSEERFELARRILDFSATTLKKYSDEQTRLVFVINRAQAYRWCGDADMARQILAKENWSTRSDDFQLAEAVLLEDFSRADQIVKRVGPNGSVKKRFYREWPLFREYRKSETFEIIFKEIFGEPLNLFSVRPSEAAGSSVDGELPRDELDEVLDQ